MTDYHKALNYLGAHYTPTQFANEVAIANHIWVTLHLDPDQVVDACFDYFVEE